MFIRRGKMKSKEELELQFIQNHTERTIRILKELKEELELLGYLSDNLASSVAGFLSTLEDRNDNLSQ